MGRLLVMLPILLSVAGCNFIHDIFGPKPPKPRTFTVAVATVGQGNVSRNPNQSTYDAGTQVQLTAVAQPGSAFSSWSGAASGSQNPITLTVNRDIAVTATFTASLMKLTVIKSGFGGGTVTGVGINCGADCTEMLGPGSVVLTAFPANGSAFNSWTGCDDVAADSCTVNMTSDRTVTAFFGSSLSGPRVTVPASSGNGSYQVTVKCVTALCSTSIIVQEAPTTAFTNPTQSFYANSPDPLILSYSGKPAGTYCYRAAFTAPQWGSAACVTVTSAATAVLRISNASSYDLIDVRLNNIQQVDYPYVILAGQSADFVFTSAGTVSYVLNNGFYNYDQSRDPLFGLTGTASVALGQTTQLTFNNPTIGGLLTNFAAAANWDGQYFDDGGNPYFARFRFTNSGDGWQFLHSTASCFGGSTCNFTQQGSGTVRLVSWPRYSAIVTFDFGPGTAPADIMYPFGSFQYANGPASWRNIEYWRQ